MKKNSIIAESLREINSFKKIMNEAYEELYQQDPQMQQEPMQGMEEEGQEEGMVDPEMDDIIAQIRELAIKGIARYAQEVESMQYQSLRKIWQETDRFYESMHNDEKKK